MDGDNSTIKMVGSVEVRQNDDGEIDTLTVWDEDDVLRDDDEFKPGFLDEKDDEFFTKDEERINHYNEYERRNQKES